MSDETRKRGERGGTRKEREGRTCNQKGGERRVRVKQKKERDETAERKETDG